MIFDVNAVWVSFTTGVIWFVSRDDHTRALLPRLRSTIHSSGAASPGANSVLNSFSELIKGMPTYSCIPLS
jgi:hypothetical protein